MKYASGKTTSAFIALQRKKGFLNCLRILLQDGKFNLKLNEDNFNQKLFKVIYKIRNKNKQRANTDNIGEKINKTNENGNIFKVFFKNRTET